jgi:hypothetical protein
VIGSPEMGLLIFILHEDSYAPDNRASPIT